MGCDGAGITLPDRDNTHLRIYAMDFPFSIESVREESLVPLDEDISGAVFAPANFGAVASRRRGTGMKGHGTSRSWNGLRPSALLAGAACWARSVWSNIRTMRSLAISSSGPNRKSGCDCRGECACVWGDSRAERQAGAEKLYLEDEIRSEMNFAQIVEAALPCAKSSKRVETVAADRFHGADLWDTGTGKE